MINDLKIYHHTKLIGSNCLIQNPFFERSESVVVSYDGSKMIITKPTIDSVLKECNVQKVGSCFKFYVNKLLPKGSFAVDSEESNEDQLVVYLES